MAMDRTMYGKIEPSAIYQPYKITIKKGSPPGCESIIFFVSLNLFLRFSKIIMILIFYYINLK